MREQASLGAQNIPFHIFTPLGEHPNSVVGDPTVQLKTDLLRQTSALLVLPALRKATALRTLQSAASLGAILEDGRIDAGTAGELAPLRALINEGLVAREFGNTDAQLMAGGALWFVLSVLCAGSVLWPLTKLTNYADVPRCQMLGTLALGLITLQLFLLMQLVRLFWITRKPTF